MSENKILGKRPKPEEDSKPEDEKSIYYFKNGLRFVN
jgi:hypothetical protein